MNDFDTVRRTLNLFIGTAVPDWKTADEIRETIAALDRIEGLHDAAIAQASEWKMQLKESEAEVERLRKESESYRALAARRGAEVERLRADIEAKRVAFLAQGEELDQASAEVERLRQENELLWGTDAGDLQREIERLNQHIMFCPEGHGVYVEKRHDYVQCPTCEVERLRAIKNAARNLLLAADHARQKGAVWLPMAILTDLRNALAEEVTPIHTDP